MAITEKGFQRLTYEEILALQTERAKLLFGEDIDVSENSTFGKILRLYCLDAADNQEMAEGVYLSAFPHSARGASLDRLCPIASISRNPATHAQHEITISGSAGTRINMGFLVSAGDVVFHTLNSYRIDSNGTVKAIVECNDAGVVGNVAVGSINSIVNPVANITGITHESVVESGQDEETDNALRARFDTALSGSGSGSADAIRGAVMRVQGVESCMVEENDTDEIVDGIPPHSIRCIVYPTTNYVAIANAVFEKKPVGIATVGTFGVPIYDVAGNEHMVWLAATTEIAIKVRCTISTNSRYTEESLQKIKDNIVEKLSSYTNGQDVTSTSLYGAVYATDGIEDVTSLTISSDGVTYSTDTISISQYQIARTAAENIEVTVNG